MRSADMDIKYSDANVQLALAPSRRLAAFIVAGAGATLALIAFAPGPGIARLAAAGWCIAAAVHAFRRAAVPRHLRIAEGVAVSVEEQGRVREGRIVAGSFVAPWLTIVHWRPDGSRFTRTIVVTPDMVDAGRFRALRVVLRWA